MALFINGGEYGGSDRYVRISMISASTLTNRVQVSRLSVPLLRTILSDKSLCCRAIKTLLYGMADIPRTFLHGGRGSDMLENLCRMLRDSTQDMVRDLEHRSVYIWVSSEDSCCYNVRRCSGFYFRWGIDQTIPSMRMVRCLAEGDERSFLAGAAGTGIERRSSAKKGEEEEEKCAICFEGFDSGSGSYEAVRLPCLHGYHTNCVLEWFDRGRATCPLCRFPSYEH